MLRICSCVALLVALALPGVGQADVTGNIRVIDGDTLDVAGTRVRLFGIDAPERDQPCTTLSGQNWSCGDWVTREVRNRYQGANARCDEITRDRYGRIVARCFVKDADIGRVLVADGLAFAYRRYAMDYDLEEKAAFVGGLGIHGFTLQSPARYRLTRRAKQHAPDPGCQIKGNINARGQRIYHLPGQKFYDKTGIQVAQGERWFCSEAQARGSGWRAAKR